MKSLTLLTTVVGLFTSGSNAFIATFYADANCQGDSYSRNVYDNTCAAPTGEFKSFEITTYGAGGQYMHWYDVGQCSSTNDIGCEGAQDGYPLNQCHNMFNDGETALGVASWAIAC